MGVGVHTGVGSAVLKVIPDIISQWEQEERGEVKHYYTLSKDDKGIGSNAFCLSSVLVFLFPLVCYFFLAFSLSTVFPVTRERQMETRGLRREEGGEKGCKEGRNTDNYRKR